MNERIMKAGRGRMMMFCWENDHVFAIIYKEKKILEIEFLTIDLHIVDFMFSIKF